MSQLAEQDDEIDLGEIFAAIWYNWWIVGLSIFVTVILVGYHTFFRATPEFLASARFELLDEQQGSASFGQGGSLGGLIGLGFLDTRGKEAEALGDRILSRPFVESLYDDASFASDPVFNSTLNEPGIRARLRNILLGEPEPRDLTKSDFLVMVVESLKERLQVLPGDNGIIELTVLHPDPERAAEIANLIVGQSIKDIFERNKKRSRETLNYFASELLQVRGDLDDASAALRDYAIENNLQSAEELARMSIQLSQLRREIELLDESAEALSSIGASAFDGNEFAISNPVSTSLVFRRLLDLPGSPSSWQKPTRSSIDNALLQIKTQKSSLLSSFNALQARARVSGEAALELAALEREVEVRQAVYESVLTQFEAQSLSSGFEPTIGRTIETAIAPDKPASPRKALNLMLGIVAGFVIGIANALIYSMTRGTVYTKTAMKDLFLSNDVVELDLSKLGKLGLKNLRTKQASYTHDFLGNLVADWKKLALVSANKGWATQRLALSIAKASVIDDNKTAFVSFSPKNFRNVVKNKKAEMVEQFWKLEVSDGLDVFVVRKRQDLHRQDVVNSVIKRFEDRYDRVIFSLPEISNEMATSLAVAKKADTVMAVVKRAESTRSDVVKARALVEKSGQANSLAVIF